MKMEMENKYIVKFVEEDCQTTIYARDDNAAIYAAKELVQLGDRGDAAVYVHVRIEKIIWDGDMVCEAPIYDDDEGGDHDWECNNDNRFF